MNCARCMESQPAPTCLVGAPCGHNVLLHPHCVLVHLPVKWIIANGTRSSPTKAFPVELANTRTNSLNPVFCDMCGFPLDTDTMNKVPLHKHGTASNSALTTDSTGDEVTNESKDEKSDDQFIMLCETCTPVQCNECRLKRYSHVVCNGKDRSCITRLYTKPKKNHKTITD